MDNNVKCTVTQIKHRFTASVLHQQSFLAQKVLTTQHTTRKLTVQKRRANEMADEIIRKNKHQCNAISVN